MKRLLFINFARAAHNSNESFESLIHVLPRLVLLD